MTPTRAPGARVRVAGALVATPQDADVPEFGKALAGAVIRSLQHPRDLAATGPTYAGRVVLGPTALARLLGVPVAPEPAGVRPDPRFADAAWTQNPAFSVLHGAYVAACRLGDDVLDAGSTNPTADAKARLA